MTMVEGDVESHVQYERVFKLDCQNGNVYEEVSKLREVLEGQWVLFGEGGSYYIGKEI